MPGSRSAKRRTPRSYTETMRASRPRAGRGAERRAAGTHHARGGTQRVPAQDLQAAGHRFDPGTLHPAQPTANRKKPPQLINFSQPTTQASSTHDNTTRDPYNRVTPRPATAPKRLPNRTTAT